MSSPTASVVRCTVDSETLQAGQLREDLLGGLGEAADGSGEADQACRPRRQVACRVSPRVSSQGTVPRCRRPGSGSRPDRGRSAPSRLRRPWGDSRRSGPIRGSGGSSGWTLGSPFFPLVESGLEGLGPDLVDEVADLELGTGRGVGGRAWRRAARPARGGRRRRPGAEPDRSCSASSACSAVRWDQDMGALRERMTTNSGDTHRKAPLYRIFHPLSRRLPVGPDESASSLIPSIRRAIIRRQRRRARNIPGSLRRVDESSRCGINESRSHGRFLGPEGVRS